MELLFSAAPVESEIKSEPQTKMEVQVEELSEEEEQEEESESEEESTEESDDERTPAERGRDKVMVRELKHTNICHNLYTIAYCSTMLYFYVSCICHSL